MERSFVSLDQLQVFVMVVDSGSFSEAARKLGRAQSAITYTIQKLEAEVGKPLFDRSAYRPALSENGRALLPYARRVLDESATFQRQMLTLTSELEAEVSIVADAVFPTYVLMEALRAFGIRFPAVQTHMFIGSLAPPAELVLNRSADIGLIVAFSNVVPDLIMRSVGVIEFLAVASPSHPLVRMQSEREMPLHGDDVRDHLQLVLAQRLYPLSNTSFTLSTRIWRLADLGVKHTMLLAGLGWGYMPRHTVNEALVSGRLVELHIEKWPGFHQPSNVPAFIAHHKEGVLGPAGRWLFERLGSDRGSSEPADTGTEGE